MSSSHNHHGNTAWTPAVNMADYPRKRDFGNGQNEGLIGEGTFGSVFVHLDKKDENKQVALKLIKQDKKKQEGFPVTTVREIKILKKLRHPNVIRLKNVVCSHQPYSLLSPLLHRSVTIFIF